MCQRMYFSTHFQSFFEDVLLPVFFPVQLQELSEFLLILRHDLFRICNISLQKTAFSSTVFLEI